MKRNRFTDEQIITFVRLLSYDGSEDMKRRDRNVSYDAYCCLV